jgi:hypothetical protein
MVRKLSLAILCLALSGGAAAQLTSTAQGQPNQSNPSQPGQPLTPDQQKQQQAPASISGKVVSTQTGQPLKKAWVIARTQGAGRQAPQMVLTDSDGKFKFKEIPAGRISLIASKNGYVTQPYGKKTTRGGATPITITAGQEVKDILFRLQRGGVIAGRIVDEDGEPVVNAQVQVLRYVYFDGDRKLVPAGSRSTDDRGEFRIASLEPRSYFVRASFRGFGAGMGIAFGGGDFGGPMGSGAMTDDNSDEGYAPLYYPGTPDIAGAVSVDVPAGDEARADITFVPMHTFRVRGRVIDSSGEAASSTQVMLTPRNSKLAFSMDYMAFVSPGGNGPKDGKFEIRGVLPGSYVLNATEWGESPQSGRTDVEVGGANVEDVVVNLGGGKEVTGVLRFEGNTTKPKKMQIFAMPVSSGGTNFFGGTGDGSVKDDGSFTLKNVLGDDYRVMVNPLEPGMFVKSIKYGNDDVLESGLNPSRGKGGTLEIVVSSNGAAVSGTVNNDNNPSSGVTVIMVPENVTKFAGQDHSTANTDQYGKFQFQGLRPGKYKLYALEDVDQGDIGDPDFMKKYEDSATSINVTEGAKVTQDLKLIPSDKAKDEQAGNQ